MNQAEVVVENKDGQVGADMKKRQKLLISIALLILFIFVIFLASIYLFKSKNAIIKNISRIIPVPVAVVRGSFIFYFDYLEESEKIDAVIDSTWGGNTTAEDSGKRALDHLIQRSLVRYLARQNKIEVSEDEVRQFLGTTVYNSQIDIFGDDIRTFLLLQKLSQTAAPRSVDDLLRDAAGSGIYKFIGL